MGPDPRRRKQADPFFGRIPKGGKGLIISNPLTLSGTAMAGIGGLDPLELRRSILFWERLVWPTPQVMRFGGGVEEEFLVEAGILKRPVIPPTSNRIQPAHEFRRIFFHAFEELESKEPGLWAMSLGESSLNIVDAPSHLKQGRGMSVELSRAIPVPDRNVPLAEVLEFKRRRIDEVARAVIALDSLFQKVVNSEDQAHQFNLAIREIDQSCTDLLKVARETEHAFRLSNWRIGYSMNPGNIGSGAVTGFAVGSIFGLPGVGALVGGMASTMTVEPVQSPVSRTVPPHPFAVAVHMEQEMF
jgi:hypothetical protein